MGGFLACTRLKNQSQSLPPVCGSPGGAVSCIGCTAFMALAASGFLVEAACAVGRLPAILRALDQDPSALLAESASIDPLDMDVRYEKALICGSMEDWKRMMRRPAHNYLELSLDYMKAGFYEDARNILAACEDPSPMVSYYLGYAWEKDRTGSTVPGTSSDSGHMEAAKEAYAKGEAACPDCCFPNRVEEVVILNAAERRSMRAAPTSSEQETPFMRNAARNAPICECDTSPPVTIRSASSISDGVKSFR